MRINQPRSLILYTLALFGVAAYGGMVWVHWRYGTLRAGHTTETLAWYGLAFAAYIAAIIWVERSGRFSWRLVWGAAVLFRLLLLFTEPTLSDDIYRYIWDGYVANNGVSPYTYALDDPALDYLDIPERTQANNTWMASPYLPAAQVVFSGLTWLFPLKAIYFQIAAVIFDLLSAWIIGRLLTLAQLPQQRILLYLWNPLIIVETAHSAHIDAFMVLLTLLAVWLALKNRDDSDALPVGSWRSFLQYLLSPILLALATLTKILPVLLMPILIWRWRWKQTLPYIVATIALLVPSGLTAGWGLTGPLDGRGLFGALRIYNDQWNFNSGLFHWLEVFLNNRSLEDPNAWAKGIVFGLMLVVLTAVFITAARNLPEVRHLREVGEVRAVRSTLRLCAIPFMAYTLLTTTVHPWYIHILLAFIPFLPPVGQSARPVMSNAESLPHWFLTAPWVYLSGALALSYLTYIDPNDYREFEWIRQLEWLPVWIMVGLATLMWLNIRVWKLKSWSL